MLDTATMTPEQAADLVDELWEELQEARDRHAVEDAYFRGEHPLCFASETWQEYHRGRYKGFADNWCQVVPTAYAERLEVTGFRLDRESLEDDALAADGDRLVRELWRRNEMDAQASQGILQSAISATSTVLVWQNPETRRAEVTWKRPDQALVQCVPGRPRERWVGIDSWCEEDESTEAELDVVHLFTREHVWKFDRPARSEVKVVGGRTEGGLLLPSSISLGNSGGGWRPRQESGDRSWPLPNPIEIDGRQVLPMVEVPNRPLLGGRPISELSGAKSMQDAINLLWAYLFVAADHASMPARVVMGTEPPKLPILDGNGVKVGEKPVDIKDLAQKRILWLTGKDASISQWDPAKLDVFTDTIQRAIRHLSAQTRTPLHTFGELQNVNGETLVAMDAGAIAKAGEFTTHAEPAVREIVALMAAADQDGNDALASACRLGNVSWKDPEIRLQAQASDAALKDRQVGLSMVTILMRRYGMTEAEARDELRRIREEQEDPQTAAVLGEIQAARAQQQAVAGGAGPA